jgi:hypothetical protein
MDTSFHPGYLREYGFYFSLLDRRHQIRFWTLVKEHSHVVNSAVSGLSALPSTAQPFAATRAMTRFLNHPDIAFHALLEPAQDAVREVLLPSGYPIVLIIHDWCMFSFHTHAGKRDRFHRSHDQDVGYELGSALVVDATDGRPLGPMELRLRTEGGLLSTRVSPTATVAGHVDELLAVMQTARHWELGRTLLHIIDREADSVGHYRRWHQRGHRFLVRADNERFVFWQDREQQLLDVVAALKPQLQDVKDKDGNPEIVTIQAGTGRIRVAQTTVVLHRPANKTIQGKTAGGHKKKIKVPGPPLELRLVVSCVMDDQGQELAQWFLLSNIEQSVADAPTLARWYAWRWRIETFHKLLKSAGMNAEEWQQETGAAFLRRLCVAVQSCLTVWHLHRDESEDAARLRKILTRLSGRQMKHRVESTVPALLAGLEKLLAIDDLLRSENITEILALAQRVLPKLFRT